MNNIYFIHIHIHNSGNSDIDNYIHIHNIYIHIHNIYIDIHNIYIHKQ